MHKGKKTPKEALIPVFIIAVAIPTALVFWLSSLLLKYLTSNNDEFEHIPPTRWLFSTFIPILIAGWGLKKGNLNKSGALFGLLVGFILTISSYCFLATLLTFFVTSSKATKFRSSLKRTMEEDFKEGGQRNWIQVICNGGVPTILALLYILDYGCGELPINFVESYRESWLALGIVGSFSCCNGDTWASELGSVFGNGPAYLITTRRPVPRGTNGGVTLGGLIFSFLGGLAIGLSYYLTIVYCVDVHVRNRSPDQWLVVLLAGVAGFLGSLIDSVLGATLQYSGVDTTKGYVVEYPAENVKHISGIRVLDNHSVNLLSTLAMAFLTPKLASIVWR